MKSALPQFSGRLPTLPAFTAVIAALTSAAATDIAKWNRIAKEAGITAC